MQKVGWLISKYLLGAIVPYFAFAWALLSVILFVQQASRYTDIFFNVNIPSNLVWQLTVALIPNVIAFTCPMAILVGTIIGLAKMQTDSELVAIRASGVGNFQIAVPILILGILLSIFAFVVNLKGVPLAASLVRNVALQTAIKKLESPLEPGVFNTEVAGLTIYVKDVDLEAGRWKNIFIYSEDAAKGEVRLITSQRGRVDTADQNSELVLENASVSTLPLKPGEGKYVAESIGEVRLAIKTRRGDLINKLSAGDMMPDELGLKELSDYAATREGKERTEAQIIWQRRILLSITPFIFCILGTVMILRFDRGGRGRAIALSLSILIGFYLLAFLGEQLARTGNISVTVGSFIPIVASSIVVTWLAFARRHEIGRTIADKISAFVTSLRTSTNKVRTKDLFVDLTTGLRDFDIIRNLLKNFLLTLAFLTAIFLIFTAFELWKFAGAMEGGTTLLIKYLFYLLPFVYLQIAPSAAMIATIATYVIKSRQNEIVTWTSAGQSVYRLLLPCFILTAILGGINFVIQETIVPRANQLQDSTRTILRSGGKPIDDHGKYWIASDTRIYSFNLVINNTVTSDNANNGSGAANSNGGGVVNNKSASDNEKRVDSSNHNVRDLSVYEFDNKGTNLQSVYRAKNAIWERGKIVLQSPIEKDVIAEGKVTPTIVKEVELEESIDPFVSTRAKPSHMTSGELRRQVATSDSDTERRSFAIALERRYTTLVLPFIIALFTAPFSLSLSRKGKVLTVGYAVALWLVFTGTGSLFEQLGQNAYLPPTLAVWSPLVIFTFLGIYLMSKIRT